MSKTWQRNNSKLNETKRTKIALYDPELNPDSEKNIILSGIKAITRKNRHNKNQVCRLNNNYIYYALLVSPVSLYQDILGNTNWGILGVETLYLHTLTGFKKLTYT